MRHPKGDETYGDPRDVAIPEPLRSYVLRYLRARVRMLADRGMLFAKPFFCRKDNPLAFHSANTLRSVKAEGEDLSVVRFKLRAFRRTYGQVLVDSSTSIGTATIALGHRSIKTTQAYYCQKSLDTVNSKVLGRCRVWLPRCKKPLDFSDRGLYQLWLGVGAEGFEPPSTGFLHAESDSARSSGHGSSLQLVITGQPTQRKSFP